MNWRSLISETSSPICLADEKSWGEKLKSEGMEKAKRFLELNEEDAESLSRFTFEPLRFGANSSFYQHFILGGIRVDRVEPGSVACSFKIPPRHADRDGKLASGTIANLVDEVGGFLVHVEGLPMQVSVDMSISFLSSANVGEELEITGKVLGQIGGYSGTVVFIRNKVTGEVIAEGRHSLFGKHTSKL